MSDELKTILNTGEVRAAMDAGSALGTAKFPLVIPGGAGSYAVVPEGYDLRDLEGQLAAPRRIRQTVTVTELLSFVAYVNRFKDPDASLVFAEEAQLRATAILDHSKPTAPAWHEHRAVLQLRATKEWMAWTSVHGKRFDQVSFAEFIENHIPEIAAPDGATLLEMVKQLDIRKAVAFESSIRLDNGQVQLTYIENISGGQAKTNATIPEAFVLGIAPFEGSAPYRLHARLRYRLSDSKLALWVELLRPEDLVPDAWRHVVEQIQVGARLPVLAGAAPVGK